MHIFCMLTDFKACGGVADLEIEKESPVVQSLGNMLPLVWFMSQNQFKTFTPAEASVEYLDKGKVQKKLKKTNKC